MKRFFICFALFIYCHVAQAQSCPGNLLANPGYESGLTNWNSFNAGDLVISSSSNTGLKAVMVPAGITGGGASDIVSATPGYQYTLSVYAKAVNSPTVWSVVELQFYNASWQLILNINKPVTSTAAVYTKFTMTGVAPAGTSFVRATLWKEVQGELYTDDWCLIANPAATTVSVGNYVFQDRNGNGKKDDIDWGIDGMPLKIYADNNDDGVADGVALDSTISSGNGFYNFIGLAPGKYFVVAESPWSSMFVSPINGGDPDNNIDDDNSGLSQSGALIKGGTIQLSIGGEPAGLNVNNTYDFALFKNNGLGDFVWVDNNGDGIQDAGEPGLAGVTVNLKNASTGAIIETTTTDANGAYFFYDPAAAGVNTYNIEFVTPAGYSPSPSNAGSDDGKDSDASGGLIANANVPNGTYNKTFDAGFVPLGSIGDYVWNDVNKNGLQDSGEPYLTGKTVVLKNGSGTTLATTTTDATGKYYFGNLVAGNYQVYFAGVSGMYLAAANVGGTTAVNNSKPNQVSGIALVALGIGENNTIIDAGYSSGVLPVKEIIIYPVLKGSEITVNWRTVNEMNTSYFEVERSYGDNHFESIGQVYTLVPQGGNGIYRIMDRNYNTSKTVITYRIKSVDIDGKESYSSIAVIRINSKTEITVWPNPVVTGINISYKASATSEVKVNVLDINGRKLMGSTHKVVSGNNQFMINGFEGLSAGSYMIEIVDVNSGEIRVYKISK